MKERRLAKLAVSVNKQTRIPDDVDARAHRMLDGWKQEVQSTLLVPLMTEPAVRTFYVHWGGGRPYGGGFSKEAYRRAKRKERKQKNK